MRNHPKAAAATALLLATAVACGEEKAMTVIHVACSGKVLGDGSRSRSVKTLERAQALVREAIAGGATGEVVVRVGHGRYELSEPLTFGPPDSGGDGLAIRWEGAGDGEVLLSGGMRLTDWRQAGDGRWRCKVDTDESIRQLYVRGRRLRRARFPKGDPLGVKRSVCKPDNKRWTVPTAMTVILDTGELKPWPETGPVELLVFKDWSIYRKQVAAIRLAERAIQLRPPFSMFNKDPKGAHNGINVPGRVKHFTCYLVGHPDFATSPGEWAHDIEAGELVYAPRAEDDLAEFAAVVPRLETLLRVVGSADRPVRNLSFRGLRFAHTALPLGPHGHDGGQASFSVPTERGKGYRPQSSAIAFQHTRECRLEACTVEAIGGTGVWAQAGCRDLHIVRNSVRDLGAVGIMIGLLHDPGAGSPDLLTGNRITDNDVSLPAQDFLGGVGIWQGFASGSLIAHNHVHRTPYTAISVGWRWNDQPTTNRANRVIANHIHHVMLRLGDGGGVYTLGNQPDSEVSGNWVHDVPRSGFSHAAPNNGLYFDQGSSGFTARDNLVHDTSGIPVRFHFRGGGSVTARDNVLVSDDAGGVISPPYRPREQRIRFRESEDNPKTGVTWGENRILTSEQWKTRADELTETYRKRTGPREAP